MSCIILCCKFIRYDFSAVCQKVQKCLQSPVIPVYVADKRDLFHRLHPCCFQQVAASFNGYTRHAMSETDCEKQLILKH